MPSFLDDIKWDLDGLIPAIAQDKDSRRILMVAWMNRAALTETIASGKAVYFSRSRQSLWRKGESSGHEQTVHAIQLDCDSDVLLLSISQAGGIACHTGRESCFYRTLCDEQWQIKDPVLKDPKEIYS